MVDEPGSNAESAVAAVAEGSGASVTAPRKPLPPAAERALAEAAQRRADIDRGAAELAAERHGRKGPEPIRYGDWEIKGLASDF